MSNGSVDYKLGEICSELKEIHARLKRNDGDIERRFKRNEDEHKEFSESIQKISLWRAKTIGAIAGIVAVVNIVVNYLFNISLT